MGVIQSDRNTLSIFGGFGKSAALKDYWDVKSNLDGDGQERRKVTYTRQDHHLVDFGMEFYYRKPVLSVHHGMVTSHDSSSEVFKMIPHDQKENDAPSLIQIANFETIDTIEEDP